MISNSHFITKECRLSKLKSDIQFVKKIIVIGIGIIIYLFKFKNRYKIFTYYMKSLRVVLHLLPVRRPRNNKKTLKNIKQ